MKVLTDSLEIPVRFSETDAMGVIWHGNYLKYFEDAREFFGAKYGMGYLDVYNQGFFTPIVKSDINHKASVYFGQRIKVNITLIYHLAAKIVFNYEVINLATDEIAATGSTTQVFLHVDKRELELAKPSFYASWEENINWGELE